MELSIATFDCKRIGKNHTKITDYPQPLSLAAQGIVQVPPAHPQQRVRSYTAKWLTPFWQSGQFHFHEDPRLYKLGDFDHYKPGHHNDSSMPSDNANLKGEHVVGTKQRLTMPGLASK